MNFDAWVHRFKYQVGTLVICSMSGDQDKDPT